LQNPNALPDSIGADPARLSGAAELREPLCFIVPINV